MKSHHETTLSGHALAMRAEQIDADSWFDQWSAAPGLDVQALRLAAARHFASDIERANPGRDTEAHQRWGALGFEPACLRSLFVKMDTPQRRADS